MRIRLFLAFALVVLISIGSVLFISRQGAARELNTFMFRGGMYGAEGIVGALEAYYRQHGSWDGVEKFFQAERGMGHGMGGGPLPNQQFQLADADRKLIVDTAGAAQGSLTPAQSERAIPLQVGAHTVGYLLPAAGMGFLPSDGDALLTRWNRAALLAALIGGGVSLLLALWLAYRLLRPVGALTQAAAALSQGDLSQRVPVEGSDEIAQLGSTFNQMAESLGRAEASRRALTADIAHELRTPLSVQRANLEAIQDGVYPLNAENLQSVLDQNLLLTRLVDDLRTLALADAGQLQLERHPIDLRKLMEGVVARFTPSAAQHGIQLSLDESAPSLPEISADALRVEQILNNLLANALRHTPQGGAITCWLELHERSIAIMVRDSGAGIPDDAMPHIFDRFYRADMGRSRVEGGSGLGLAIARQLAEAHQGSLTAANHAEGGALFTLSLPLSES